MQCHPIDVGRHKFQISVGLDHGWMQDLLSHKYQAVQAQRSDAVQTSLPTYRQPVVCILVLLVTTDWLSPNMTERYTGIPIYCRVNRRSMICSVAVRPATNSDPYVRFDGVLFLARLLVWMHWKERKNSRSRFMRCTRSGRV